MDLGTQQSDDENGFEEEVLARPRPLPDDLPKSLDDRQPVRHYGGETEMYDAWQGMRSTFHRTFEDEAMALNLLYMQVNPNS